VPWIAVRIGTSWNGETYRAREPILPGRDIPFLLEGVAQEGVRIVRLRFSIRRLSNGDRRIGDEDTGDVLTGRPVPIPEIRRSQCVYRQGYNVDVRPTGIEGYLQLRAILTYRRSGRLHDTSSPIVYDLLWRRETDISIVRPSVSLPLRTKQCKAYGRSGTFECRGDNNHKPDL
jgi:hypothetical protein